MKNTKKTTPSPSWLQKLKVAVAALAFVALGVFGASVADAPAPTEVDETTSSWSYRIDPVEVPTYEKPLPFEKPLPIGKPSPGTYGLRSSWS